MIYGLFVRYKRQFCTELVSWEHHSLSVHRCQPSRIWRLCPLSRPESAIYLKCPGFSRLLLLSWDNRVQTSSTTLELWLESLNHVSFMHSAVYLVATTNCFAVLWVGLSNKIIYWACMRMKQLLNSMQSLQWNLPSQETVFFVPEIILWRLAPMEHVAYQLSQIKKVHSWEVAFVYLHIP